MDKKYIHLIHKDLDGVLTAQEKQEFESALKADEELRKLYEEFRHMSDQLNQVPQVEPPENLKKQILDSIDFKQYQPKPVKQDWLKRIPEWFTEPRLRLVYGIAAGILIGILSTIFLFPGLITQSQLQLKDLYGTIGIHQEDLNVLEELPIIQNSLQGSVKVTSYLNFVGLELNYTTAQETVIRLEYDKARLVFRGINILKSESTSLKQAENRIIFTSSETSHFLLLFEKLSTSIFPLNLKIEQEGENILEQTFTE